MTMTKTRQAIWQAMHPGFIMMYLSGAVFFFLIGKGYLPEFSIPDVLFTWTVVVAVIVMWQTRRVVFRHLEDGQKEDDERNKREECIYEDAGRSSSLYLRAYLKAHDYAQSDAREKLGSLDPRYINSGLRWLARRVEEAADLKRVQYQMLPLLTMCMSREQEEVFRRTLEQQYADVASEFFEARDGLVALISDGKPSTAFCELEFVRDNIKGWSDALNLPYKVQ